MNDRRKLRMDWVILAALLSGALAMLALSAAAVNWAMIWVPLVSAYLGLVLLALFILLAVERKWGWGWLPRALGWLLLQAAIWLPILALAALAFALNMYAGFLLLLGATMLVIARRVAESGPMPRSRITAASLLPPRAAKR